MRRFLIVNADDFGYSYSINKGIIEAHASGIVTSTSVMVDGVSAHEAVDLIGFSELAVGLHFELKDLTNVAGELARQIEKFVTIVGRHPDHIDTHKRDTRDEGIKQVLEEFARVSSIPIRNFDAKHIGSFGVNSDDSSIAQLKRSIDEADEVYNELMTHAGYSDDYLREHSSYSDPREVELKAICSPEIREYIRQKGITLINWRQLPRGHLGVS